MRTETLPAPAEEPRPLLDAVLDRFGLAGEAFAALDGRAGVAATFISADWVLQRRPISQRGRISMARRLAAERPGHPALEGCRYHALMLLEPGAGGLGPDAFWTLQERIQGYCPGADTTQSAPRLLEMAARMVPAAVAQLTELSRLRIPREAWLAQPTRGLALQSTTPALVLAHVRGLAPATGELLAHRLGSEPESRIVLAHGDPILANQVLRDTDAPLIDWETLGALPQQTDLAHIASYLCRCLPADRWEEAADLVAEHAAPLLGWGARAFRRAVLWQLVRDLVAYPSAHQERELEAVARLAAKP